MGLRCVLRAASSAMKHPTGIDVATIDIKQPTVSGFKKSSNGWV